MRNGAHLRSQFVYQAETILDRLDRMRTHCAGFVCQGSQVHTQGSKDLTGAVVELASNAPSLFILHLQQPTGKITEAFFGSLALGNVANGGGNQDALLRLQRAETDRYRKLQAILVQTIQLHTYPHRPHSWFGEEAGAVFWMQAATTL